MALNAKVKQRLLHKVAVLVQLVHFLSSKMLSLKETRDVVLPSHSQGLITDDFRFKHIKNPEFSYDNNARFELDELKQAECKAVFRIQTN